MLESRGGGDPELSPFEDSKIIYKINIIQLPTIACVPIGITKSSLGPPSLENCLRIHSDVGLFQDCVKMDERGVS